MFSFVSLLEQRVETGYFTILECEKCQTDVSIQLLITSWKILGWSTFTVKDMENLLIINPNTKTFLFPVPESIK